MQHCVFTLNSEQTQTRFRAALNRRCKDALMHQLLIFVFEIQTEICTIVFFEDIKLWAATELIFPSSRDTWLTAIAFCDAKFKVWAKHPVCGPNPASLTALSSFLALSMVTATGFLKIVSSLSHLSDL